MNEIENITLLLDFSETLSFSVDQVVHIFIKPVSPLQSSLFSFKIDGVMRNFTTPDPEVEEDTFIRNIIIVVCTVVPFGLLLIASVIVRLVCFLKKRRLIK